MLGGVLIGCNTFLFTYQLMNGQKQNGQKRLGAILVNNKFHS